MKLKVLEIKGEKAFLIKSGVLESYLTYLLNGVELSDAQKRSRLVVSAEDKLQSLSNNKELIEYRRGDEVMSKEEYKSKPKYYDEDCSDEDTLRAIANKKELQGFEPCYKDPMPENIDLDVVGYIEATGSEFISCSITNKWSDNAVLYTTYGRLITLNEYSVLSKKHSDHAKFGKPDGSYLRFVKINGNYAFDDYYPFGDCEYAKIFLNLEDAKAEEEKIRIAVRDKVNKRVFKDSLTEHKNLQVLSNLKSINKLKTKKAMNEMMSILIKDLSDYTSNIKK